MMNSSNVTITLPYSLDRRKIMDVVNEVSSIKSNVLLIKNGRSAPMKSALGLLSLCCQQGDTVEIVCMSRESNADEDLQKAVEILKHD